jgi:electron transfer flavoprotein alpha subunit
MDAPLPCVLGITASEGGPEMSLFDLVHAAFSPVIVLDMVKSGAGDVIRYERPAAAIGETRTITNTREAAEYLKAFAAEVSAARAEDYTGETRPGDLPKGKVAWALLGPVAQKSNAAVLRACRFAADLRGREAYALVAAPRDAWPALLWLAKVNGSKLGVCVDTGAGMLSQEGKQEIIRSILNVSEDSLIVAGTDWTDTFALAAGESTGSGNNVRVFSSVTKMTGKEAGRIILSSPAYDNRLVRVETFGRGVALISVLQEGDFPAAMSKSAFSAMAAEIKVKPDWIVPLPPLPKPSLSMADVIIDLGYGIRDKEGMGLALELKKRLEVLGLLPLFGATRKVTQDLKLLPLDAQIGQTGVRVNPKLIIALGISGAPQHIDYIGTRAEIVCLNKDREAPLMKLNQTRSAPRVHPIAGDLFVTVRDLLKELE